MNISNNEGIKSKHIDGKMSDNAIELSYKLNVPEVEEPL